MSSEDKGTLRDLDLLLRAYYANLYVVAVKIVVKSDVAEDIVQDVFIKYWENREKYLNVDSLENLLFIMVRNASISFLRQNKREIKRNAEFESGRGDSQFINRLIEEETYRILNHAISVLPDKMKVISRLVLKGHTNPEIAKILGVSLNTVKTLKYIAIRRLRAYMSNI